MLFDKYEFDVERGTNKLMALFDDQLPWRSRRHYLFRLTGHLRLPPQGYKVSRVCDYSERINLT